MPHAALALPQAEVTSDILIDIKNTLFDMKEIERLLRAMLVCAGITKGQFIYRHIEKLRAAGGQGPFVKIRNWERTGIIIDLKHNTENGSHYCGSLNCSNTKPEDLRSMLMQGLGGGIFPPPVAQFPVAKQPAATPSSADVPQSPVPHVPVAQVEATPAILTSAQKWGAIIAQLEAQAEEFKTAQALLEVIVAEKAECATKLAEVDAQLASYAAEKATLEAAQAKLDTDGRNISAILATPEIAQAAEKLAVINSAIGKIA